MARAAGLGRIAHRAGWALLFGNLGDGAGKLRRFDANDRSAPVLGVRGESRTWGERAEADRAHDPASLPVRGEPRLVDQGGALASGTQAVLPDWPSPATSRLRRALNCVAAVPPGRESLRAELGAAGAENTLMAAPSGKARSSEKSPGLVLGRPLPEL